jgi:hypothetical protein
VVPLLGCPEWQPTFSFHGKAEGHASCPPQIEHVAYWPILLNKSDSRAK